MATTKDLIDFVAPEFEGLTDSAKDMAIDMASQRISAEAFGRLYQQAIAYLSAHILAGAQGTATEVGVAGQITSVKTGDLSIGAQALQGFTGADASLASTPYGKQYLELRDKIPGGPLLG